MKKKDLKNKGNYDINYEDIGALGFIWLGLIGARLCFDFVLKILKGDYRKK